MYRSEVQAGIRNTASKPVPTEHRKQLPPIRLLPLARFSNCLSVMLGASIGLVRALDIVADSDPDDIVCLAADQVARNVESGHPLSAALSKLDGPFDEVYCRMVLAGENCGDLPKVLTGLARDAERRYHQATSVKQALAYPGAVFGVSLSMAAFMVYYMLPKFMGFFDGMGAELPLMTKILIFVVFSPVMRWGLVLALIAALGAYFYLGQHDAQARAGREFLKYNLPLIGRVNHLMTLSHFCRHLSMLGESGVMLADGLRILKRGTGSERLNSAVGGVRERIIEGNNFSDALAMDPIFPRLLVQSVTASEEGSNLFTALERAARVLEDEAQSKLNTIIPLLEPLLMAVMGGLVGFIVLAMFLPIYQLVATQI